MVVTWKHKDKAGYTLVEILVVLGIMVTILGISIGVYQRMNVSYELPAAKSRVSSIIRAARNTSRSSGLPSRVFVETGEVQRVTAFGYELVSGFHFEEAGEIEGEEPLPEGTLMRAAFNETGEVVGKVFAARGKVGAGLEFADNGAAVVVPYRPSFHGDRGFAIEAWVIFDQPQLPKKKRNKSRRKGGWIDPRRDDYFAIVSLQGSYELGLLGDCTVYVTIGDPLDAAIDQDNDYCVVTTPNTIVPGRWTHIRATYDGIDLLVEVDGIERFWTPDGFEKIDPVDWPPLPAHIPKATGDLTISRPDRMFLGVIDEPKVRVALPPTTYDVAPSVRILGQARTIYFDTRGSLDPKFHTNPVVIQLTDRPEPEADDTTGHTAVEGATDENGVPLNGTGGYADEGYGDDEDLEDEELDQDESEIQDVLEALVKYLEENREKSDTELYQSVKKYARPKDGEEMAEGERQGRVETIVIDLTGTIRG